MYQFCLGFNKKSVQGGDPPCKPPRRWSVVVALRADAPNNQNFAAAKILWNAAPSGHTGFLHACMHSNIIIPKYMNTFVIKWYRKMNSIVDVLIIEYRYFLYKLCTETVYKSREKKTYFLWQKEIICGRKCLKNFACGAHRHSPYGGVGKYCHTKKMPQNPS